MLIPLVRNRNIPQECSTSAARLHLLSARAWAFIRKDLRPLLYESALWASLDLATGQGQGLKDSLVSKLRLAIRFLACTLAWCALVVSGRSVLLSHRNPTRTMAYVGRSTQASRNFTQIRQCTTDQKTNANPCWLTRHQKFRQVLALL